MGRSPYPASESGPWVQGTPQVHHDDFVDVSAHLASGGPRLSDAHSHLQAGRSTLAAGAGFASNSDRWMPGTLLNRCRLYKTKKHTWHASAVRPLPPLPLRRFLFVPPTFSSVVSFVLLLSPSAIWSLYSKVSIAHHNIKDIYSSSLVRTVWQLVS